MMLCVTGMSPSCRWHWLSFFPRSSEGGWTWLSVRGVFWTAVFALSLVRVSAAAGDQPVPNSYAISFYNVYAGLPSNGAPLCRQTRDGYIWVGTELGLSRFDGVRFVNYRVANTPELQSNLIRSIIEDKAGTFWIGTQGGLCRYRKGKFERIGLDGSPIAGLIEDASGAIWIQTDNKGLWQYRDGHLISHAEAPGMPNKPKNPVAIILYLDSQKRLWLGPSDEIKHYDGQTARPAELGNPPFRSIFRVVETADRTFWFDTEKGLHRWRDGEYRRYGPDDGIGRDLVRNLSVDQKGRLWVFMNGLYLLEDPASDRFVRIPLPGVENPRFVIEDHEGSYWIGTAGDGIVRLRSSGFRMITAENGLFGGNTRTVALDRAGNMWAGLATTGVARTDPTGNAEVIATGEGAAGEVWSVLPASDGRVWIGTRTSLRLWDAGKQEEFPKFQRIRSLFEDRAGTIWIGSENEGVTYYKDGTFTSLSAEIKAKQPEFPAALPPVAMAFAEDAGGTMYIGLRDSGGLVKLKDGALTLYHSSEGFPTNEIRAIYPDPEGNLWIGTKGRGLAVLSEGRWLNPEVLCESFNDLVAAVVEDEKGQLWLGTPKGIMWAPKAQLLALARGEPVTEKFRLATESDGMRPAVVGAGSFPGAWKSDDGSLWFATRRGIAAVQPSKIVFNNVPPPVHIEQVVVDNKRMSSTEEIRLPPGSRSVTINYTALSYVGPNRVFFRFRLEGNGDEWTDAGTRRAAFYTNLDPGTFRFHVIACNDDGVWNETGASTTIVQLPFFYQTTWFYGLVVLSLLGGGFGLFRWRTAALQRRNLELESGIAERTRELAKSYEAIRASEYFYHSLVESLPQIIVRKDIDGRFTYANTGFGELVGHPLDQLIGKLESEMYPKERAEKFRADDLRAMETHQTLEYETIATQPGKPPRYLHVKKVPLYNQQGRAMGVQILFWDMTTFREIEEKLKQAQRELVETSRLAGIAEMATGILHNLGNALNSVNITTTLTITRLRRSKVAFVGKTAQLLTEHRDRLPEFFSFDPRGAKLPGYLTELAGHLANENKEVLADLQGLQASVDHIKELVASQQQHARVSGVTETVPASELMEYALRISETSLKRHEITVVREFTAVALVKVERQKALQIISNLLANAKDALMQSGRPDKRIAVGVRASAIGVVQIYVTDNGVGIAPENLTRIFAFGFTTKKGGHGFGLHSSALAAKELGGSLNGQSEGQERGATFVLELAAVSPEDAETKSTPPVALANTLNPASK